MNRGLVHDCEVLLSIKDTLGGTDDLDWSPGTPINSWDEVTIRDAPRRVTKLELSGRKLGGNIPPGMGSLSKLTHLDLRRNSLTGSISREVGWLDYLKAVKLSRNSLTGCIPIALESVDSNDLRSLKLSYCQPPAPGGLSADVIDETTISLAWDAVPDTTKYSVEYRLNFDRQAEDWTMADDSFMGTSWTFNGLSSEKTYQFRVRAYGSGAIYPDGWGEGSTIVAMTAPEFRGPVFDSSSYAFNIAEDAEYWTTVGKVSTKGDYRGAGYTIQAGNKGRRFWIDRGSGEIMVAASLSLDRDPTASYTLIVQVSDYVWIDQAEVVINVMEE